MTPTQCLLKLKAISSPYFYHIFKKLISLSFAVYIIYIRNKQTLPPL
ncbi:hypothetical protein [Sulfolobus spindle-shaped virus]|nr:hypothetical protein [Sulfolobus spindle-shaped virus]AZG03598.1 hypothetical protein [Sulfolobus spindle-shaped virus]AZG03631.1 hypothetical protein [Sulfolobus spindle-shaped virus]AZG03695.1 hypothetical protein [Sulfolobus spindle-shaped virus]AZG03700.1 hypothetical protein [Sulfolobus spindle-shaped virus]